jgi:teichoic acid transport system ATP-binding protein
MNKEPVIELNNIVKTYKLYDQNMDRVKEVFSPTRKKYHREFNALDNVTLTIGKGETVGIVGRNGSGKSTLLQVMCGILSPSSGSMHSNGRISALLELGAGFNPQYSGRQNVYINAAIQGFSRQEIDNRFDEIADFADIGSFIEQPVRLYSSGMYVRLAFAVAVTVDPNILIVDEALAVGDAQFQAKCFGKFREFQKKGVTIIFVTHALDLITRYCDHAYLMEKGKCIDSGEPKTVVDEYNRLIVNCSERHGIQAKKSREIAQHLEPVKEADSVADLIEWEGLFTVNPKENRYGIGDALIIEGGIFNSAGEPVQTLVKGLPYEFRFKVKFNKEIEDPIFAYTIKDIQGFDISGTNSLFQHVETGICEKDDVVLVRFSHKMSLNPGGYLLSLGCTGYEKGQYVVYDRRYDHFVFDVISERAYVGFVDLDSQISIELLTGERS